MTADELRALAHQSGLPGKDVAALAGVEPGTYWRWLAGKHRIPKAAAELLRLKLAPKEN